MSRVLDTWSYEAMAMAFSLGCFVAVFLILITYNNNTVPHYFPGITLNAIISTLGTASKSALLYVIAKCVGQLNWIWFYKSKKKKPLSAIQVFDSASRGPLGSLFLILQHRGQTLVSLGATITVLTLIFDPSMQQVLTYPIRERLVNGTSSGATTKTSGCRPPGAYRR
jgi:hypothetical protein